MEKRTTRYRRVLENEGFSVEEKTVQQMTLTGSSIVEDVATGSVEGRRGAARISVTVTDKGVRVTAVAHLSSSEEAGRLAEKLEALGGMVDVESGRVSAKFKEPGLGTVASIARETARAVKGGRERH